MDILYEEADEKVIARVKDHMKSCDGCRAEFEALKETSAVLQKWEDVDPDMNMVFVREQNAFWSNLRERFRISPARLGYGFALGAAALFLMLALANTEIRYDQGSFSMRFGIMKSNDSAKTVSTMDQALLTSLQEQNMQLMSRMIEQSEQRQRQQLISALNQFSNNYQDVRSSDLKTVGTSLDEIERELYRRLEKRTNEQYNDLIRQINFQEGNR
jgi:DNA anti-recombination protein RmuC